MPTDEHILRMMSYERSHAYRISTNYLVDSIATKKCFDYFTESINRSESNIESGLKGYLQEISAVPFGMMFVCNQQVKNN